jgi:hypothetical protein
VHPDQPRVDNRPWAAASVPQPNRSFCLPVWLERHYHLRFRMPAQENRHEACRSRARALRQTAAGSLGRWWLRLWRHSDNSFCADVQVLARSGLDFMIVDMEHGPVDVQSAHAMIAATGGTPLVPFVRVAGKESWQAKIPLDLGAMGI